jgi:hypothetical protein
MTIGRKRAGTSIAPEEPNSEDGSWQITYTDKLYRLGIMTEEERGQLALLVAKYGVGPVARQVAEVTIAQADAYLQNADQGDEVERVKANLAKSEGSELRRFSFQIRG